MSNGIVIDARKLGDGGIGVYVENLVYGLLELPEYKSGEWRITLLIEPDFIERAKTSEDVAGLVADWRDGVSFITEKAKKYSIEEYFLIAHRHRDFFRSQNLYHSPHYTLPYHLAIPTVVTVHDVIHVSHPDTVWHSLVGKYLIRSAVRRSAHIITVSEASAVALSRMAHISPTKLAVIPNSLRYRVKSELSEGRRVELSQFGLSKKNYFVFVGSDRPHKGFDLLLDAWSIFRETFANKIANSVKSDPGIQFLDSPKLLVIGERFGQNVRNRAVSMGIDADLVFQSTLSTSVLAELLTQSAGVIIPSIEEGFGLVALEAISVGVPVVSFPVASLREVCGEAGWFADEFSAEALVDVMIKMLDNNALAALKCRYGKRLAGCYSLQRFARSTQDVYQKLVGQKASRTCVDVRRAI